MNKKNIYQLKNDYKMFILDIMEKEGESHVIYFIQEWYKIYIRDTELKTIELLSYYTKHMMYRNHYWEKG